MRLDERFLEFALLGSGWVLWLLVGLSLMAMTVAVERALAYRSSARTQALLRDRMLVSWSSVVDGTAPDDPLTALERCLGPKDSPAARVVVTMLRAASSGHQAVQSIARATKSRERTALDGGLLILGTIGANAPFVGLFGTVLDILGVFHFLGGQQFGAGANTAAIMAGLSGALVATAMGLLVAIPSVALYNALLRRQEALLGQVDELSEMANAFIVADGGSDGYAGGK